MKKILFISLFFISQASSYKITGKVIRIADGDTVTIMTSDHKKYKIRLASIDVPDKSQPFGKKSKRMLAKMIASQSVVAKCTGKDRYKRNICTIFGTLTNKGTTDISKKTKHSKSKFISINYLTKSISQEFVLS